jgi:hypothetical protein
LNAKQDVFRLATLAAEALKLASCAAEILAYLDSARKLH